jgi:predicted ester cyclase
MSDSNDLQRNKELVGRCIEEIWNGGRTERIPAFIHPSFRRHHPRNADFDVYGQRGFSVWVSEVRSALPDIHLAVELQFAEEDRVMLHLRGTGTHQGELYGLAASGKALDFTVTGLVRLADELIAECWIIPDELGVRQQLGDIPSFG